MIKHVSIITGRKELLEAMRISQGNSNPVIKTPSYKTIMRAFISRHGTLSKYIFKVVAEVPDRVHTHLRTHHLMNEFYTCSTSRPDITSDNGETRLIEFYVPVKRLIEIYELRLCRKSWHETIEFMKELKSRLIKLEPLLEPILQPLCIHRGYCPELNRTCGYVRSINARGLRDNLLNMSKALSGNREIW